MSGPPLLAVHVGRVVPELLTQVLSAATPWCSPVAVSASEPPPEGVVAHLYTSEVLPGRPAGPFAVWRSPGHDGHADGAAAVLVPAGTAGIGPADVVVSPSPLPPGSRPVLPFTRGRYRELRGLPARMVGRAEQGDLTWADAGAETMPAPPDSWPTLAALSAAVVATGDHVWEALAWGAPVVTDPSGAASWGLTDGREVLVGATGAVRRDLAVALADDESRAAGLASRGWTGARDRTVERVAERLCRELGLVRRHDLVPPAGLTTALDQLGTPRSALIRRRAREAAAALPGAVTSGWWPLERRAHAHT